MPKLSIITINLNNKEGLTQTIESVVNQTFTDYEYIIIDGGSNDGSVDTINEYSPKISYWVSEPDKGIYNAMNKGILQAKGDYCLFLNSGDYLSDKTIFEKVFEKEIATDLLYGNLIFIEKRKNWEKTYPEKLTFEYFLKDCLPHPATFIKRKLFETIGSYNENNKIVSDWEFFLLAICKCNCSYTHLDFPITEFNAFGSSSNIENTYIIKLEKNAALQKYFSTFLDDYAKLDAIRSELNNLKLSKFFKYGYRFTQILKNKVFILWKAR